MQINTDGDDTVNLDQIWQEHLDMTTLRHTRIGDRFGARVNTLIVYNQG